MGVLKTNLGKWRSIEFECVFKTRAGLREFEAFLEVNKKYKKFVAIKDDGSICPTDSDEVDSDVYYDQTSKEIVVNYVSGKDQIVRDVCEFISKRAYVNASCGTHVHFDMRHVTPDEARLYGARLACVVPALKTMLPKSRRDNEFCARTINDVEGNGQRYAFVNLCAYRKYKTIEVRGHSGTLNAAKILNWIAICEKVMFSEKTKSVKNIKDLVKHYKLGKDLAEFAITRRREVNRRRVVNET